MAKYECNSCGMSVNTSCGNCDTDLVNGSLELEDGSTVQIAEGPEGGGKIKSPLCCGEDMSCSI